MLPLVLLICVGLVAGFDTGWHYGDWNSSRCLQTYEANTHLHEVPTFSRLPGFRPPGQHRSMLSRVITPEVRIPRIPSVRLLTCRPDRFL